MINEGNVREHRVGQVTATQGDIVKTSEDKVKVDGKEDEERKDNSDIPEEVWKCSGEGFLTGLFSKIKENEIRNV